MEIYTNKRYVKVSSEGSKKEPSIQYASNASMSRGRGTGTKPT